MMVTHFAFVIHFNLNACFSLFLMLYYVALPAADSFLSVLEYNGRETVVEPAAIKINKGWLPLRAYTFTTVHSTGLNSIIAFYCVKTQLLF